MAASDLMYRAGNSDVSTREVTALSDSVAHEKCLREWQQVPGRSLWTLRSGEVVASWICFSSSSSLKSLFSCSSLDGPVCIGWDSRLNTKGCVLVCCFMRRKLCAGVRAFWRVKTVGDFSSSQWNVIFNFSRCSFHVCVHGGASRGEILCFFPTPGGSGQSYTSSETFECKGLWRAAFKEMNP